MRRSLFTLRALATLTLSAASALPQHADKGILAEQTFSCSAEQSLSLCCTGRTSSNGAAQDCEESVHFMIGPTRLSANDYSRQLHSSTVNQCSSEQLAKGFKRPVCCKAGFKPAAGAPGYNGMNCIDGAVDGGSKWSFQPKSDSVRSSKYSGVSRRAARSIIPNTSPLASAVETIPVADDEARIFALGPEPEFPERLEGSPSSPSSKVPSPSPSNAPPSNAPVGLGSILSKVDVPVARRTLRKRSRETYTDAEPSGSGHQTQDAVLKDLLTSTSLIQRASRAETLAGTGSVAKRSTTTRRRNPRGMTGDESVYS